MPSEAEFFNCSKGKALMLTATGTLVLGLAAIFSFVVGGKLGIIMTAFDLGVGGAAFLAIACCSKSEERTPLLPS